METGIRTSFIPKAALTSAPKPRKEGMGFLVFLGMLAFIVSLLGWLAAYTYNSLVARDVATLEASINKAKEAFDPARLKVFENLDRRLRAAETLLTSHKSVEPLFTLLDSLTLKSVRFTNFSYVDSTTAGTVRLSGEALDFQSVALQALEFSKDSRIINPIFSNLGVDPKSGRIRFDVSFNVSESLTRYQVPIGNNI